MFPFFTTKPTLESGDESVFKPVLEAHLKSAAIMLVLLSPAWLKSHWCNWEFSIFNTSNRPVIPILWNAVDGEKVHSAAIRKKLINKEHLQYLHKSDEEFEVLVRKIVAYL